ncbi:response regulator transcription factor [Kordiimonas aestuarii]|uniref:response regulator transcription factor n=1 Tax=Kordiimonas aestuarii TaxID=1005925 RepID=UPI0021CF0713|nr:response regulator transcription factor [Kordiimonas aestuarii]
MADTVKIVVLDDHRMFLDGISMLVESMAPHYAVSNFHMPVNLLGSLENNTQYDLIICDLIMDQMNGLAFVAAARAHNKRVPILMLSGINTDPPIAEMVRLGASGFVHKSADNETLQRAVESLLAGGSFFEGYEKLGGMSAEPVDSVRFDEACALTDPLPSLGKRQTEVLKMISQGASNKEISNRLAISENTVKTHLRHIFTALGVNKRTACVRKAQALGLI